MAKVVLTGRSGAGKTTVLDEAARPRLADGGHDYDGWALTGSDWDEPRMTRLLAELADELERLLDPL